MRDRNTDSTSSNAKLAEAGSKEFFWGCELTKAKPEIVWTFEEEDGDQDFLQHTLFLKQAVLGSSATAEEKNIVEIETTNFAGDTVKQPLVSLTAGKTDMCHLDLNFGHEIPVTFRLAEGSGPLFLCAQQLVEFPTEFDEDYTETEYTEDEEEDLEGLAEEEGDEEVEDEEDSAKPKKRKRGKLGGAKKKRGKLDSDANGESAEDEDEESMEEETEETEEGSDEASEEEEEEEEEESDEETPKKKVKKLVAKNGKTKGPKKMAKPVKAAPVKKASGKKVKAK